MVEDCTKEEMIILYKEYAADYRKYCEGRKKGLNANALELDITPTKEKYIIALGTLYNAANS